MHRITRPAAENHMMRVFAVNRRAIISGGLEAGNPGTEIPASGSLAEVAADGAHVPQRRTSDGLTRLGKRREPDLHPLVGRDRSNGRGRAESKGAIFEPGD
jgi:hypothetical protein